MYTRSPDIQASLPLWGRDEKVNEVMPDLCISIHHDSSSNPAAKGFSIHWSSYRYKLDRKDIFIYMGSKKYPVVSQTQQMKGTREYTYVTYINSYGRNAVADVAEPSLVVRDSTLCGAAKGSKEFANILYKNLLKLD